MNIDITYYTRVFGFKIEEANFSKGFIPKHIILDRTRNIHSYIVFCDICEGKSSSIYWDNNSSKEGVISIVQTQYSQLNRPLFFVFQKDKQFVCIEGNEVREKLLANPEVDIISYMWNNSMSFMETSMLIHKEL